MPDTGASSGAEHASALVLECRGAPSALDRLHLPTEAEAVRLRPDRCLVVVTDLDPSEHERWTQQISGSSPDLLVVDVSAGWVARVVAEDAVSQLVASTSMWPDGLDPTTGPRAGLVAGVPAVVLPTAEGFVVLVGASRDHHLAAVLPDARFPRRSEIAR